MLSASAVELKSVNPKLKNKLQLLEHLQDALNSLSSSRGDLSGFPANIAYLRMHHRHASYKLSSMLLTLKIGRISSSLHRKQ
ncbi:hypothetical protein RB213_001405 [Colletotrichum asianum]